MEPLYEEIGIWLEREVAGCQFRDVRHGKRFRSLVEQLIVSFRTYGLMRGRSLPVIFSARGSALPPR